MPGCSERYDEHMQHPAGLRERKKRRTREQIVEAAMRLFSERGYAATTIADIAAAADIAPRTFFAYFPSKEAVVFSDADEDFASLAAALQERRPGETAFATLRRWIDERFELWSGEHAEASLRKSLCRESEELARVEHALMARFEDLLREAVARDLDQPPDALRPRLVAAATIAAVRSLEVHAPETEERTRARAIAVLDEALVFLQGGIEALQRHEPPS